MAGPGLQQSQTLSQQQVIAPQMQQSLRILQAPTLELRQMVRQELVVNPVLEDETEEISVEELQLDRDEEDFREEFSELSRLDDEWREYRVQANAEMRPSREQEERRRFMMDSLTVPETLAQHLREQLATADIAGERRGLVELLIGSIGDDGFLRTSLEDLSASTMIPLDELEDALELVQTFDPSGVGARDLRECLLIQLRRQGRVDSLEYRIVDKHLDELARRRYPQIARRLGVSTAGVDHAAGLIAGLDPKPGARFGNGENQFVTPDVVVERSDTGDGYAARLTNEQVPRLRISNHYKDLLAGEARAEGVSHYIRDKIRGAKFLIKSIHQRQETILKIANEVVRRQREFFAQGPSGLKPMNMHEVAEEVGVHETTVSRAIAGKYMATPRGLFEMKYFFTTGYQTSSGDSLSNTSVKQAIAALVKGENPSKPLSDQAMAAKLSEQGIDIARRTVAKYREDLNILPSHLRKKY